MIDILLSTYNGERFLEQQINSIINQTNKDWQLIIRDDGSTDSTINIIESFTKNYPNKIFIDKDDLGNVGVVKSFEILLRQSKSAYIMFCDQDDVWLPTKIDITFDRMRALESTNGRKTPILVHTDLIIVDENLDFISQSFCKFSGINPRIINSSIYYLGICNSVTGCTVMINSAAQNKALPFADNTEMHDAWIAICVKKNDGVLSFMEEQTILYRQHSNNTLGAMKNQFILKEKILNLQKTIKNNSKRYRNTFKIFVCDSVFVYLYYKIKYFILIRL